MCSINHPPHFALLPSLCIFVASISPHTGIERGCMVPDESVLSSPPRSDERRADREPVKLRRQRKSHVDSTITEDQSGRKQTFYYPLCHQR
ncbi:hypothetical protein LDENG_00106940 [Lucifuga dentata]|nr:hypothetical protein LDENG_00106940 [Lucifuga dentata]